MSWERKKKLIWKRKRKDILFHWENPRGATIVSGNAKFSRSIFRFPLLFRSVFVIGFPSLHNTTNKSRKSKSKSKSYVNSSTFRLPRLISPNSLSKVTFSRVSSLDRPCHTEIDSSRFFYGGKFGAFFFSSCFVYKLCCLVSEKILGGNFKFCWFFLAYW